jgi:membrane protein
MNAKNSKRHGELLDDNLRPDRATEEGLSEELARRGSRSAVPLWITGLTLALLSLGFRPRRYAGTLSRRPWPRARPRSDARAAPVDRGRLVRTPSESPARGWKDVLLRIYDKLSKDRVILVAAGIAFYTILAIFPAIAAMVALYGLFADPSSIATQLDNLVGVLPEGAIAIIKQEISRVAAQSNNTLGFTFLASLAISLWSANAGIKSLFDGLNLVYDQEEKRGLIRLNVVSLVFTTGAIVVLLASMVVIVALPLLLDSLGLEQEIDLIVRVGRWPLMLLVITVAVAIVYRYGPSREQPQWRWITWGSAFASIVWLAASILFSWYAASFGSYNKTYGSLGAIIAFMVWIWLSTIVVLIGAEIDAEMEHQTVRDTADRAALAR